MSEDKLSAGRLIDYMKEKKSLWLIAAALGLGILLMVLGQQENISGAVTVSAKAETIIGLEAELEARVTALCGRVGGVSDVSVMVTLASYSEQVYAQDVQSSQSESSSDLRLEYVLTGSSGSQQPIPTVELTPRVQGVAVVCSGGDDANVQLKLTNLLCALFDIPASCVSIVGTGN
ncbi:MAG: hypothetical protein IJ493_05265 [Clostridia bacterium]|nr:hypothetical protein [Clostridia bacterium]